MVEAEISTGLFQRAISKPSKPLKAVAGGGCGYLGQSDGGLKARQWAEGSRWRLPWKASLVACLALGPRAKLVLSWLIREPSFCGFGRSTCRRSIHLAQPAAREARFAGSSSVTWPLRRSVNWPPCGGHSLPIENRGIDGALVERLRAEAGPEPRSAKPTVGDDVGGASWTEAPVGGSGTRLRPDHRADFESHTTVRAIFQGEK